MDNINSDANPTNLELLRLARDLAYSDYNNRKADIHNKWVSDSALLWKNQRLRLAYPAIPSYPTEEEIVRRALKLVEFLNTARPDLEYQYNQPIAAPVKDPVSDIAAVTYSEAPVAEESSEKVLSSMMKKFENLFNKGDKK